MIDKLKIVKNVSVYSTVNTWDTYKNIISAIKAKLLNEDIKVSSVRYRDSFDEKYRPYTNEKNWGSNLDEYTVKLDNNLKASITYFSISRYSSQFENRVFKFEISFKLPESILVLFENYIERAFYYKCCEIREKELQQIEDKRIKEIGKELLKQK
jgi:hypothetical protein